MYAQSVIFHIRRNRLSGASKSLEWPKIASDVVRVPDESWYFDTTVAEKGFSTLALPIQIKESIIQSIKKGRLEIAERLFKVFPSPLFIRSIIKPIDIDFMGPKDIFIHNEKPLSIVIKDTENSFIVLAESKVDCIRVIDKFHKSFKGLSKATKNFGYQLDSFSVGKDFAKTWIMAESASQVKDIVEKKPKNDFEIKVTSLLSQMTDSFISNAEVFFRTPSESFEYDIVLVLSKKLVIVIEVKDYRSFLEDLKRKKRTLDPFKDNMKSSLILRTIDKAVKLSPHVQILLILRGFPSDVVERMDKIAESRGILVSNDYGLEAKLKRLMVYVTTRLIHESKEDFDKNLEEFLRTKTDKDTV